MIPEDLRPEDIERQLTTRWLGRSLVVVASTGSTSDDARAAAEGGAPHGHVVLADHQERGRGTRGRTWSSPPGQDLYLSLIVRPTGPVPALPTLTLAVGLAVADAVETLGASPAEVKWPNDVWVNRRKCAGILTETTTRGAAPDHAVVGIGLNVNRTVLPPELTERATSIAMALGDGRTVPRAQALAVLLGHVESWSDRWQEHGVESVVSALDSRMALRGTAVRCGGLSGTLLGLAPSGGVRIESAEGTVHEVLAGEITPAAD